MPEAASVRHVQVADEDDGIRLDRWFKRHLPALTHGQLEKLLRTGQVRLDGARAKSNARISSGQEIRLPPGAQTAPERREAPVPVLSRDDKKFLQSLILAETKTFVALSKPAGLAVQGGSGTRRHLDGLLKALGEETGERWRLVHRLDRDTSGVLLLAKSADYAAKLAETFRARETDKVYWALTAGVPSPRQGRIDLALVKRANPARHGREAMAAAEDDDPEAQRAITDFMVLDDAKRIAFVAARPVTGRTHQIRAHLAALGTPILGDFKYGGERAHPGGAIPAGLMLHARSLTFRDPEGRRRQVTAPPPRAFAEALTLFGFEAPAEPLPFPDL